MEEVVKTNLNAGGSSREGEVKAQKGPFFGNAWAFILFLILILLILGPWWSGA